MPERTLCVVYSSPSGHGPHPPAERRAASGYPDETSVNANMMTDDGRGLEGEAVDAHGHHHVKGLGGRALLFAWPGLAFALR